MAKGVGYQRPLLRSNRTLRLLPSLCHCRPSIDVLGRRSKVIRFANTSMITLVSAVSMWLAGTGPLRGQEADDVSIRLANPRTEQWQVGVVVRARGQVTGIVATMPVPMPWPEQDVNIIREETSPQVRGVQYRLLEDGVRQMTVTIPRLAGGEQASVLVTMEIVKRDIAAPTAPEKLRVPLRVPRDVRKYLLPSPYIDSRDGKIQEAVRHVVADRPGAWQQVEAIFDWVREKVEYRFDERIKSSRQALDDGFGDCEELTSLFIAMCRAAGIPARAVWVPGHCYPEFYLEDPQGNGHWYPCQAAGSRIFGSMVETRPILQKGDSFRVPGSRKPQRYVQDTLVAKSAAVDPEVEFIRRNLKEEHEK